MKITRRQLRKIIKEAMYKGVPVKFAPDHKKKMGQEMRDNPEFLNLLRTGQARFGEEGLRYEPELGPDGRPIGVSMRDRTEQEKMGFDSYLQQTREKEEERLADLRKPKPLQPGEEMIAGARVATVSPTGRGKNRPTYGHTSIGTYFAPDGLSDEEAVEHLRSRFAGAPMWKFDISRDPETKKIYAYYEIDTSG